MKIEKNIFWIVFPICMHSRQKPEGYYQSSGLDLYCYVLILNDVHVLIHRSTGSPLARTNLSPFARCTLGLNRHFY